MRILICDDHKIMRDGLRQMISLMANVLFIQEAANGEEALNHLKTEAFDILLLDISLPDRSGLDVLEIVKLKWPEVNVLILSMHAQQQYAIRALKLGASGFLSKDVASEELLVAIRKVASGGIYVSDSLAESLAGLYNRNQVKKEHDKLSHREFEIMIHLVNGKSLLEIASILFISNKTVSTHRRRILDKMEMKKNTDLVRYCIDNNLI